MNRRDKILIGIVTVIVFVILSAILWTGQQIVNDIEEREAEAIEMAQSEPEPEPEPKLSRYQYVKKTFEELGVEVLIGGFEGDFWGNDRRLLNNDWNAFDDYVTLIKKYNITLIFDSSKMLNIYCSAQFAFEYENRLYIFYIHSSCVEVD